MPREPVALTNKAIEKAISDYELSYHGLSFWVPYAINEPGVPKGPFKGKGTPSQIKSSLRRILSEYKDPLRNGEEIRYLMYRNNLGVDCSGFAYYVLDSFLRSLSLQPLAHYLYVKRREILEAYEKPSWRQKGFSIKEVQQMPEMISLADVAQRFKKNPAMLTDVRRLCDNLATTRVRRPEDVQTGDMVNLSSQYGDHIWVISNNKSGQVTFAQSQFDPVGPGGIAVTELSALNFSKRVGQKDIVDIRRLKGLDGK